MIRVYECFAYRQRGAARRLEVDRDERAGRGPSAWQKERLAFFDKTVIPVAQRIVAQIGPIVSHTHSNGCLLSVAYSQHKRDIVVVVVVVRG